MRIVNKLAMTVRCRTILNDTTDNPRGIVFKIIAKKKLGNRPFGISYFWKGYWEKQDKGKESLGNFPNRVEEDQARLKKNYAVSGNNQGKVL